MVLSEFKGIELAPGLDGAMLDPTRPQSKMFFLTRAGWLSHNKLRY